MSLELTTPLIRGSGHQAVSIGFDHNDTPPLLGGWIIEEFRSFDQRVDWHVIARNTLFIALCAIGRVALYNLGAAQESSESSLSTFSGISYTSCFFALTLVSYMLLRERLNASFLTLDTCPKRVKFLFEKFIIFSAGIIGYTPWLILAYQFNDNSLLMMLLALANTPSTIYSLNESIEVVKYRYNVFQARSLLNNWQNSSSQPQFNYQYVSNNHLRIIPYNVTDAKLVLFKTKLLNLLRKAADDFLTLSSSSKLKFTSSIDRILMERSASDQSILPKLINVIFHNRSRYALPSDSSNNVNYRNTIEKAAIIALCSIFLLVTGVIAYEGCEKKPLEFSNASIITAIVIVAINTLLFYRSTSAGVSFIINNVENCIRRKKRYTFVEQSSKPLTYFLKAIAATFVAGTYQANVNIVKTYFSGALQTALLGTYPIASQVMLLGPMTNIAEKTSQTITRLTKDKATVQGLNFLKILEKLSYKIYHCNQREIAKIILFCLSNLEDKQIYEDISTALKTSGLTIKDILSYR